MRKGQPSWNDIYQLALNYFKENGNLNIEQCVCVGDVKLGDWISTQRRTYKLGKLSDERKHLLDEIGMIWDWCEFRWEQNYTEAKKYYDKNGHLNVLRKENPKLYTWIRTQKAAYTGYRGQLSKEKISRLNALNIEWDIIENTWNAMYKKAKSYYKRHGKLNIPVYCNVDDEKLGYWLARQRRAYKNYSQGISGGGKLKMTPERIKLLENIGMVWDVTYLGRKTSFPESAVLYYLKQHYEDACKINQEDFLGKELDIFIPSKKIAVEYDGYVWHSQKTDDDILKDNLCFEYGIKVIRLREPGLSTLESSYCIMLESDDWDGIEKGIVDLFSYLRLPTPDCDLDRDYLLIHEEHLRYMSHKWDNVFEELLTRYKKNGSVVVKPGECLSDGTNLYNWLSLRREEYKSGTMTDEHREKLLSIGISLDPFDEKWQRGYEAAKLYYKTNGNLLVPVGFVDKDSFPLGKWIAHRRENYRLGILKETQIEQLESIGICWNVLKSKQEAKRKLFLQFLEEFGLAKLKATTKYHGENLGYWWSDQKKKFKEGKMKDEEIKFFSNLGIYFK